MRFPLLLLFLFSFLSLSAQLQLPSVLSDGMILQRNTEVCLWGQGKPYNTVFIMPEWTTETKARVDSSGNWMLTIPSGRTKGPFSLKIIHNNEVKIIKDILFGEVWLCSGQSNMEMPLSGWPPRDTIEGGKKEIAEYSNSDIRMFTVERGFSFQKERNCKGSWKKAIGDEKSNFSATAYFFAKKLNAELQVPIGILNTSFGGSSAEAWTNPEYLKLMPDFVDWVRLYPELQKQQTELEKWITAKKSVPVINNNFLNLNFNDQACASPTYADDRWYQMELPATWESSGLAGFDGTVWFRKTFWLPENWKGSARLQLPGIDDMDRTYLNGKLVGSTEETGKWQMERRYTVSEGILKPGANIIAIRVTDTQGGGGIWDNRPMKVVNQTDSSLSVALSGSWKYLPVAEFRNSRFYLYNPETMEFATRPKATSGTIETPGALYNAMLAPLVPYTVKGFAWYQGETNVGRAEQYKRLLPLLIEGWRDAWKQKSLPFYVVQIAPYDYAGGNFSGYLRNAQRLVAASNPRTELVVTLDVGAKDNVHPMKKREVGERLAAIALTKEYGKSIPFSGPKLKSIAAQNEKLVVEFSFAEGLKITQTGEFEIAGEDKKFYPAVVNIKENTLELTNSAVKAPKFVRYAMNDSSQAVLFNGAGLPASCFTNEE